MKTKLRYTFFKYVLIMLVVLTFVYNVMPSDLKVIYSDNEESREKLYRDFLITQLSPYITQAITDYYGYPKSYGLFNAKVLNIKRLEKGTYYFEIQIQVISFEGPHNPPYGVETVTVRKDHTGIYVKDFIHEEYKHKGSS